ncbi:MAG: hypothetical protein KKB50_06355 [Planctomycetes bacterium]|nr:hypothetical protein [Planctomycetota bacterium]
MLQPLLSLLVGLAVVPGNADVLSTPTDFACGESRTLLDQRGWDTQRECDPAAAETDVLHYDLEIEIRPADKWLGGTNTMFVRSLVDDLTTFPIRLQQCLGPQRITLNGTALGWQRLDEQRLEVTLDRPYQADEQFVLQVTYAGFPRSLWWGTLEFASQGEQPLVYSFGAPWYSCTWWPVKESNCDKTTATLAFTVPETLVVASTGLLTDIDVIEPGRKRYQWETVYPTAPYLYCFSATDYHVFSETFVHAEGTMPVDFFVYPSSDTPQTRAALRKSLEMLTCYGELFGVYPFVQEKFGIYQFGFGGGMEHQTMVGQGQFPEWLTAHELAHQWWGDMITCATWHDIWLNEGFATYAEALWAEHKPGSSGLPALHTRMDEQRPGRVDGSVYVYDCFDADRVFSGDFSYCKAAWVLHMLRHVVGEATFFEILAAYRTAYEYGCATTEDFIAVAEQVYGGKLGWFFEPWVYGSGAPAYEYGWQPVSLGSDHYVAVHVAQVQDAAQARFTMPIDIVVRSAGRATTHTIWNDAGAEHFLLPVTEPVEALAFDPECWILTKPKHAKCVDFVPGPPKIVRITPTPGSNVLAEDVTTIAIAFHRDVLAGSADFGLVGQNTGPVEFICSYDRVTRTATLSPARPLAEDEYTLRVRDTIVTAQDRLALDGEVASARSPLALPSGDGLPGGDVVVRFTVTPAGLAAR